jgi:hypothetical protein
VTAISRDEAIERLETAWACEHGACLEQRRQRDSAREIAVRLEQENALLLWLLTETRWANKGTAKERQSLFFRNPTDPRHGTTNGYRNLECRCQPCRDAHWAYTAERRVARSKALTAGDPRHGMASTYINHGCRCAPCASAAASARARSLAASEPTDGQP